MTEDAPGPAPIYFAKGIRVFVSGLLAIMIPFYLKTIGYGPLFQGLALVAILAGNTMSNVAVTYLEAAMGRKRLLQTFSLLMVASGVTLAASASAVPILAACFIGNMSSTGTEAGPFQSIEAGILPNLTPAGAVVKVFGRYNLVGYSAAAAGQLASAGPGLFGYSQAAFQSVFGGFAFVGAALFIVYGSLGHLESGRPTKPGLSHLTPDARKDVLRLSGLFSLDAFGATFVTTYLLSIWFSSVYGLQLEALGTVFSAATVLSAASTYGAALVAQKIGNLRTMVYTHLASSTFLVSMALAGSLTLALAFLFLRQSLSQMDVPTRQALMTEMFRQDERVKAFAVTNTLRSTGSFLGSPIAAALLAVGLVSAIPFAGGAVKIAYDLMVYGSYRTRYR